MSGHFYDVYTLKPEYCTRENIKELVKIAPLYVTIPSWSYTFEEDGVTKTWEQAFSFMKRGAHSYSIPFCFRRDPLYDGYGCIGTSLSLSSECMKGAYFGVEGIRKGDGALSEEEVDLLLLNVKGACLCEMAALRELPKEWLDKYFNKTTKEFSEAQWRDRRAGRCPP